MVCQFSTGNVQIGWVAVSHTGEMIRFEGEPRCPECGRTLAIQQRPRSVKTSTLILAGLLLIILGGAGTGAYLYFRAHQGPSAPPPGPPHLSETDTSQTTTPPSAIAKDPAPDAKSPVLVKTKSIKLPPDLAKVALPPPGAAPPATSPESPAPPKPDAFQPEQKEVPETPPLSKAEIDCDAFRRLETNQYHAQNGRPGKRTPSRKGRNRPLDGTPADRSL